MKPMNLLLIGGGAAALYYWWTHREEVAALPAAPVNAGATTTTAPAPGPAAPAFNSLDAIYTRLAAAVGSAPQTSDTFNWYLHEAAPTITPPDPCSVFGATCGRDTTMTLAQYWAGMAPYLKNSMGLSGLGFFGGLGSISRAVQ